MNWHRLAPHATQIGSLSTTRDSSQNDFHAKNIEIEGVGKAKTKIWWLPYGRQHTPELHYLCMTISHACREYREIFPLSLYPIDPASLKALMPLFVRGNCISKA